MLERFVSRSHETAAHAFEGLVLRHGTMVLDVCNRVLGDPHDAQDAFQATFLVLATRARSIRRQKSVGSWLHGVALRVARRARSDAARRMAHERSIAEMTRREIAAEDPADALDYRTLHEEVERLPRTYREPVVLCYLEGDFDSAVELQSQAIALYTDAADKKKGEAWLETYFELLKIQSEKKAHAG